MGLTVSDAFRLMLTRVAREKALPFEPLIENDTTIAGMREARAVNLPRVKTRRCVTGKTQCGRLNGRPGSSATTSASRRVFTA